MAGMGNGLNFCGVVPFSSIFSDNAEIGETALYRRSYWATLGVGSSSGGGSKT